MSKPKWFEVVSPECYEIIPILDYGAGPKEFWRDFVYVRTTTKRRARVLALRWFRRQFKGWEARKRDYLDPSENPFRGMQVQVAATPENTNG